MIPLCLLCTSLVSFVVKNQRMYLFEKIIKIWGNKYLIILICCVFFYSINSYSQQIDSATYAQKVKKLNEDAKTKLFPGWTLYVPGATFFYNGRVGEGIMFSALEAGV